MQDFLNYYLYGILLTFIWGLYVVRTQHKISGYWNKLVSLVSISISSLLWPVTWILIGVRVAYALCSKVFFYLSIKYNL